jgi:ubiquinone/menaquinone biosynthesis C-methylase UbiE
LVEVAGDTAGHYARLAGRYDANWTYSAEFIDWMSACIIDRLDVQPTDRVVDLGCGTGLFSIRLAERAGQVICVDPSAEMLGQLPDNDALIPLQASAEEIVSGVKRIPETTVDAVLVKEAIHHVRDPATVISGLAGMLAPGGRLLVVMLPTTISYPLFRGALELFERLQPDPRVIAEEMGASGLNVDLEYESFGLEFPRDRYMAMVRDRYMSLLSEFDDAAIEEGIREIEETYTDEVLRFSDRFAFILGRRQ